MINRKKRIVIKVGGSTLTNADYSLNFKRLRRLISEIVELKTSGYQPIVVTSGAIPTGFGALKSSRYPITFPEKQAAASVGQGILMQVYEQMFSKYGFLVGQILLTQDDFAVRSRYINIDNTFEMLLQNDVIPVVNENDTVAIDEIKVGDNDTLGALVAALVDADKYIILSDIDGLYSANPRIDKNAVIIPVVHEITAELEEMAGDRGSTGATGGMKTKIKAARIATASGTEVIIANGSEDQILYRIINGEMAGTRFLKSEEPLSSRKSWLAFSTRLDGSVVIDSGAVRAIVLKNSSLLAAGVIDVEGKFDAGSVVSISGPDGSEIGRGIVNFSSSDIQLLKGKQSAEIPVYISDLSSRNYEVIHRDSLALY